MAIAALVAAGILAGLSLDKVIVQLSARPRIGVTAYAAYARAADLGHGIIFCAAAGVGAAVLTLAAFAVATGRGPRRRSRGCWPQPACSRLLTAS